MRPTAAPTSRFPALVLSVGLLLCAAVGPSGSSAQAGDTVAYAQDWENGFGGWKAVGGGGASIDCATAHAGNCSLAQGEHASIWAPYVQSPALGISLDTRVTVSFFFQGIPQSIGCCSGDSAFSLLLDDGSQYVVAIRNANGQSCVSLGGPGVVGASACDGGMAFHFDEVRATLDPAARTVSAQLLDGDGAPVGPIGSGAYPALAKRLQTLGIEGYPRTATTLAPFHYDTITVTTSAGGSATTPLSLQAVGAQGSIVLSWQPPPTTVDFPILAYNVYRGDASGSETLLRKEWQGAPAFVDTGLDDRTTYYYTVTAVTPSGESPPSREASATTFSAAPAPCGGPFTTIVPSHEGRVDRVAYKLGLLVCYDGSEHGAVEEGVLDGPLPLTTPAYVYEHATGPDADGDGVPSSLTLRFRTTTIHDDGTTTSADDHEQAVALDPDDADPHDPVPEVAPPAPVPGAHAKARTRGA